MTIPELAESLKGKWCWCTNFPFGVSIPPWPNGSKPVSLAEVVGYSSTGIICHFTEDTGWDANFMERNVNGVVWFDRKDGVWQVDPLDLDTELYVAKPAIVRPDKCWLCGSPCITLFNTIECNELGCPNYKP